MFSIFNRRNNRDVCIIVDNTWIRGFCSLDWRWAAIIVKIETVRQMSSTYTCIRLPNCISLISECKVCLVNS